MQELVEGLDAGALYSTVAHLRSANAAELATGDKRKTQARLCTLLYVKSCCMLDRVSLQEENLVLHPSTQLPSLSQRMLATSRASGRAAGVRVHVLRQPGMVFRLVQWQVLYSIRWPAWAPALQVQLLLPYVGWGD